MMHGSLAAKSVEPLLERSIGNRTDSSVVFAQTSASRVDVIERLSISTIGGGDFAITRIARKKAGHGMTDGAARSDSYVACVHLERLDAYDLWCDDEHASPSTLEVGALHINDMRLAWRADIRGPFDVVNFCVPQSALDEITSEENSPPITLHCPINFACADVVMQNVAQALLPALAQPDQTSRVFTDYAGRAVLAHLARTYTQFRPKCSKGGLAPWQERRAKEMLRANLAGDLGLRQLASACRLSTGHFSRAFKHTVGCAPHQWLIHQRVERAKQLILNTDEPLCGIALDAGFADQSHFTRVFSQRMKASPAAWRRAQGRSTTEIRLEAAQK
jgi:AraC family transcriptional regulator